MTGPEHYKEAERLLGVAERGVGDHGLIDRQRALATAGVHATLALAAATALQVPGGESAGMALADASAWERACSLNPQYEDSES